MVSESSGISFYELVDKSNPHNKKLTWLELIDRWEPNYICVLETLG